MENKCTPPNFPSDTQGALIALIHALISTRSKLLDRCGDREVVTTMMDNIIVVMDEIVGGVAIQARVPEPPEASSEVRWREAVKRIHGSDTKISCLLQTILHPQDLRLIDRYRTVVVENNEKTYAIEAAFTYLRAAAQKAFAAVDAKNNAAAAVAKEEKIRGQKSILLRAIDSLRCKDNIVHAEAISDLQQQVRELDRSLLIWLPECSPEQYCVVVDAIMESAQREPNAPAQYCGARAVFVATGGV